MTLSASPAFPFIVSAAESSKLVWGAASWLPVAAAVAGVLLLLVLAGYWRASGASRGLRLVAGALKLLGVLILAACLLEPLASGARARPGANQFVVLADNSRSMSLPSRPDAPADSKSRGDELKALIAPDAKWLARVGRDFDFRQYAFDTQLRTLARADDLTFDGQSTALGAALDRLTRRFHNRPLAGVFLLTDGNPTDAEALEKLLAQDSPSAKAISQTEEDIRKDLKDLIDVKGCRSFLVEQARRKNKNLDSEVGR